MGRIERAPRRLRRLRLGRPCRLRGRRRLGVAAGYPQYADVARRLAALPAHAVPAITMDGKAHGAVPATEGRSSASKLKGPRSHRVIEGAGHNRPEEAPKEVADAVWE